MMLAQNLDKPLAAYDEFRVQLSHLRDYNDSQVFDYESKKGNKEARSHIHMLRKTKAAVEKRRKEEKQVALDYGRKVDGEAKGIMSEIDSMIEVHQKPLDEIEQREKERQAKHEARIEQMRNLAIPTNESISANEIARRLRELDTFNLGPHWEEFLEEATRVAAQVRADLESWLERQEKYEAEQAELAALRREREERERQEHDEKIRREAEERARREAAEQAQREKAAAEARERDLKERAERAEREAADAARKAREEAERKAAQERAEAEKREADQRHRAKIETAAVEALMGAGFTYDSAGQIIRLIADKKIPHVLITY